VVEGRIMSRRTAVRLAIAALVLAIAAVILVIVAANTGDEDPSLPDARQAVKQTPTPTPTPTTPSPTPTISEEEAAEAAALEIPQKFHDVEGEVRSDPSSVLDELDAYEEVAAGPLLEESKTDAANIPYTGFTQSGAATVISADVLAVDLENSRGISPNGPSVVIHVCTDVSTADYERSGEPWDPGDEVLSAEWDLRNYDYPDPDGWRVWNIEASDESCEG
jgi:hypothetical protein